MNVASSLSQHFKLEQLQRATFHSWEPSTREGNGNAEVCLRPQDDADALVACGFPGLYLAATLKIITRNDRQE